MAYWPFDEGYGAIAHDEGVFRGHGTVSGATWQEESACISGKCLYFDGLDDVVSGISSTTAGVNNIFDNDIYNFTDGGTISFWMKAVSWGEDDHGIILNKGSNGTAEGWRIRLDGATQALIFNHKFGSTDGEWRTPAIELNKYYHISLSYDKTSTSNNPVIYLNGAAQSLTEVLTPLGSVGDDSLYEMRIGNNCGSGTDYSFKGFLDEIKMYRYIRTAAQVLQEYAQGLSGQGSIKTSSISFGSVSDKWLSDGLVGYWKMDETATTSGALDSSGNGNTGTYYGHASTTGGRFGRGGSFDGVDDYMNTGALDYTAANTRENGITYSAWFKFGSLALTEYGIAGAGSRTTNASYGAGGLRAGRGPSYRYVQFSIYDGQYKNAILPQALALQEGIWYHAVGVYDPITSKSLLYLNGVLAATQDVTKSGITLDPGYSYIGKNMHTTDNYYFNGSIDEVRIYNRALNEDEIRKLYEWVPGPVLHLKMDEKSGTTTYDSSGNNLHGAISGATYVPGKYGRALSFDGVDDMVAVTQSDLLKPLYAITFSAWIKHSGSDQVMDCLVWDGGSADAYRINIDNSGTEGYGVNSAVWTTTVDTDWHYVSGVYDGSATTLKLYVDGILRASDTSAGSIIDYASFGNQQLLLGDDSDESACGAIMDDVKIYNYPRTQKQILEDMHSGNPLKGKLLSLKMDEGYGSYAYDDSPYGNTGTLTTPASGGNTTVTQMWSMNGKFGNAVEFDGTNDYIDIADNYSLQSNDSFTVAVWVKYSTSQNQYAGIFTDGNGSTDRNYALGVNYGGSDNKVYWSIYDGSWSVTLSTNNLNNGTWHHLVGVRDKDNDILKLYVDGVLNSTTTDTTTTNIDDSTTSKFVGKYLYGGGSNNVYFSGEIDNLNFYAYALNDEEIKKEYNQESAIAVGSLSTASSTQSAGSKSRQYCVPGDTANCASPIVEISMNEKSGTTFYDKSGYGNNATSTGATLVVGKIGNGLGFDGNDYVSITHTASLPLNLATPNNTISLWVKGSSGSSQSFFSISRTTMNYPYLRFRKSSDKMDAIIMDSSSQQKLNKTSTLTVFDNQWHQVTWTDNNGTATLYIDGVKDPTSFNYTPATMNNLNVTTLGAFRFGNSISEYFSGQIDQLRIYNYARTKAQVAWDYNNGEPIGHWNFNECQSGTIHDQSGFNNHGTLYLGSSGVTATGTCASSSNSFWYNGKDGKSNGGGSFDGVDDYVDLGNNSRFNFTATTSFSASYWFKDSSNAGGMLSKMNTSLKGWTLYANVGELFLIISNPYPSSHMQKVCSFYDFSSTEWMHFLVTYDGSNDVNGIKLYKNGEECITYGHSNTLGTNTIEVSDNLLMGKIYNGSGYEHAGKMDEVKIWNYALTAEQAKQDYVGGAARFVQ